MNSVATNKTQQYNTRAKDYIYKWRQKNMDKYRIINRKGQAKYREKHKDKIKMYKKAYYLLFKEKGYVGNLNMFCIVYA